MKTMETEICRAARNRAFGGICKPLPPQLRAHTTLLIYRNTAAPVRIKPIVCFASCFADGLLRLMTA
jgi:hypothetical protein